MGVSSHHPLYAEHLPDWVQLRDTYRGERYVKARGEIYLPATSGMHADGMMPPAAGYLAYDAYRRRARFPEFVKAAIESMIGIMHNKPPNIELPPALEPLLERATLRRESLHLLLRRINEEQLVMGRVGLMADVLNGKGTKLPHIVTYFAEDIINWDDGMSEEQRLDSLNLVVLSENDPKRVSVFDWEQNKNRYRVLVLGSPGENEPTGIYRSGVFDEADGATFNESELIIPSLAGRSLDRIPFVFVNAKDIVASPDEPPLLGLSNLALTVYRGEADYRQALFMQGQDTLVVIGGEADKTYRTGANAAISLPISGDAKYIGVDSTGLTEMRTALENDHARASRKSGELFDETSRDRESGEALRVRVAARTSTLNQIALAGAFGLQEILRIIAVWVGADPEAVKVTPNLDFVDDTMQGEELVQIMTAKGLGAPLSLESIHVSMQQRGMTEKTYEDELEAIENERDLELVPSPSTNPNGPEMDDDGTPQPDSGEPADPEEDEEESR